MILRHTNHFTESTTLPKSLADIEIWSANFWIRQREKLDFHFNYTLDCTVSSTNEIFRNFQKYYFFFWYHKSVACRQLGFHEGQQMVDTFNQTFDGAPGICLTNVSCVGNENRLVDCRRSTGFQNNCSHEDDVFLSCYPSQWQEKNMLSLIVLFIILHSMLSTFEWNSNLSEMFQLKTWVKCFNSKLEWNVSTQNLSEMFQLQLEWNVSTQNLNELNRESYPLNGEWTDAYLLECADFLSRST